MTFRILSLLRYVVDIVKSSTNPKVFLKSNENWQTGSQPKYNSWTFFVFLDHLLENYKESLFIWYKLIFLLLKHIYIFWNNRVWRKKNLQPLPPKNGRFCGKITIVFTTLGQKKILVLINTQWCFKIFCTLKNYLSSLIFDLPTFQGGGGLP